MCQIHTVEYYAAIESCKHYEISCLVKDTRHKKLHIEWAYMNEISRKAKL